jgi:hypothetical protein
MNLRGIAKDLCDILSVRNVFFVSFSQAAVRLYIFALWSEHQHILPLELNDASRICEFVASMPSGRDLKH